MSLPMSWVDKIFTKLVLVYGQPFLNRWMGVEIAEVKADWAHELAGFENYPEGIHHALQNLPPGKPPTVLEFREIARRCPPPKFKALPAPKTDPAKVRALLDDLRKRLGIRPASNSGHDQINERKAG